MHADIGHERTLEPYQIDTPERSEPPRALLISLAVVIALAAVAGLNSAALLWSQGSWLADTDQHLHFAILLMCAAASFARAVRIQGPLDYKLSQAVRTAIVFVGIYALAILVGRLFFSRSMLIATASASVAGSCALVWLKHLMSGAQVALIAPLAPGVHHAPTAVVIHNPSTDLRGFDCALVSLQGQIPAEWSRALSRAMLAGCRVRHVGEYLEELKGAVSPEHFELEHLPRNGIASYRPLKRAIDIAGVVFLLPVALPLLLISAAAILVSSGGPVFFIQERVGLGEKPFRMWKLRTMRPTRPDEGVVAAVIGDKRVTPVGRILRRFRIDELPQLWNVLKGDMSLIGPRPEACQLHESYAERLPSYGYRYLVRPGITGWAQVSAPPSVSAEEARTKLTYDLFYVKKLSLYLDFKIVLRTFWTITAGSGAR